MSASSSAAERSPARLVWLLLAVAYGAGIWYLSSQSFRAVPERGGIWPFLSNFFHFPLFGGLALLLAEAFKTVTERAGAESWRGLTRRRLGIVLGLTLAYAIVDELHQAATPGRQPDAGDVATDVLGGVTALVMWWGVRGPGHGAPALWRAAGLTGLAMLLVGIRVSLR